jgi:ketosteroid isomerase-like protein
LIVTQLTTTEVESAVRKYWAVSAAKEARQQEDFYANHAVVFTSASKRLELARLVSMQRQREYLAKSTKLRIVVADIQVIPLGTTAAVAAYTLEFHAEDMPVEGKVKKTPDEHLSNARVTHVFERGDDGTLKIVHEHISLAAQG